LRSSGNDPALIQDLLNDAQLLELLTRNLKKQVETFRSLKGRYISDTWRVLHEHAPDQLLKEMDKLGTEIQSLKAGCEKRLADLTNSSQNIIQLVLQHALTN
jgi:hypothetical protein